MPELPYRARVTGKPKERKSERHRPTQEAQGLGDTKGELCAVKGRPGLERGACGGDRGSPGEEALDLPLCSALLGGQVSGWAGVRMVPGTVGFGQKPRPWPAGWVSVRWVSALQPQQVL